jgi:hypothetical protein
MELIPVYIDPLIFRRAWMSLFKNGIIEEHLDLDYYNTYKSNFEKEFNCKILAEFKPGHQVRFNTPADQTLFLLKWS